MWADKDYLTADDVNALRIEIIKEIKDTQFPDCFDAMNERIARFLSQLLRMLLPIGGNENPSRILKGVEEKVREHFPLACEHCRRCDNCRLARYCPVPFLEGVFERDALETLRGILTYIYQRIAQRALGVIPEEGQSKCDSVMKPFTQWLHITLLAHRHEFKDPWSYSQVTHQLRDIVREYEVAAYFPQVKPAVSTEPTIPPLQVAAHDYDHLKKNLLDFMGTYTMTQLVERYKSSIKEAPERRVYHEGNEYSERFANLLILQCLIKWRDRQSSSLESVKLNRVREHNGWNEYTAAEGSQFQYTEYDVFYNENSHFVYFKSNRIFCTRELPRRSKLKKIGNIDSDLRVLKFFIEFISRSEFKSQVLSGEVKSSTSSAKEMKRFLGSNGLHIIRSSNVKNDVTELLTKFLADETKVVLCSRETKMLAKIIEPFKEPSLKRVRAIGHNLRSVLKNIYVDTLTGGEEGRKAVKKCTVLCSNLKSLNLSLKESFIETNRTVAIIANAQWVSEPESLIPMALGCNCVILVGDFNRRSGDRTEGLGASLMQRLARGPHRTPPKRRARSIYLYDSDSDLSSESDDSLPSGDLHATTSLARSERDGSDPRRERDASPHVDQED